MKILNKLELDNYNGELETIFIDSYSFLIKNPIPSPNPVNSNIKVYDINDLNKFEIVEVVNMSFLFISIHTNNIMIYSL
jgi:hypothetical protein